MYELFLAKKNERHILSLGGRIIPEINYIVMVILHSLWLSSLFYLTFFTEILIRKELFFSFLFMFVIGQSLRILAIRTLGKRWSTRIVILPNVDAVSKGIFKWVKHPNYIGVIIEILALPLMVGFFKIALIFSFFNLIILYFRVRLEEKYLREYNNYDFVFNIQKEKCE